MSALSEKVKTQIVNLIENANATTGNTDTTLTDGVNALIEGYGKNSEPLLQDITINENGSYLPENGYDGFSSVTVEVASSGGGVGLSVKGGLVKNPLQSNTLNANTNLSVSYQFSTRDS